MSLLNQMLKDLEARHASPLSAHAGVLAGVQPSPAEYRSPVPRRLLLGLAYCVLLVAAMFAGMQAFDSRDDVSVLPTRTDTAAMATAPAAVTVSAAEPQLALPALKLSEMVAMPAVHEAANDAAVEASLLQQAVAPVVVSEVPDVPPVSPAVQVIKRVVEARDPAAIASDKYREAVDRVDAGDGQAAVPLLLDVLGIEPGNMKARLLLIAQLMARGALAHAGQLIDQGLALQPTHAGLRQLKARFLADNGRVGEALELLSTAAPAVRDEADYHALRAALLRQAGRYAESAGVYRALLAEFPRRADWWAGLAMNLEADQHLAAAKLAYTRALDGDGLSATLRAYASARLQSLAAVRAAD